MAEGERKLTKYQNQRKKRSIIRRGGGARKLKVMERSRTKASPGGGGGGGGGWGGGLVTCFLGLWGVWVFYGFGVRWYVVWGIVLYCGLCCGGGGGGGGGVVVLVGGNRGWGGVWGVGVWVGGGCWGGKEATGQKKMSGWDAFWNSQKVGTTRISEKRDSSKRDCS